MKLKLRKSWSYLLVSSVSIAGLAGCANTSVKTSAVKDDVTASETTQAVSTATPADEQLSPADRAWRDAVNKSTNNFSNDRFVLAARYGQRSLVRYMLQSGVDVNAVDVYGDTALISAAGGGHLAVVGDLLVAGADIDTVNDAGHTALMNAAMKGRADVVELLLDEDADIAVETGAGETALTKAVQYGSRVVADILLVRGADPNVQNTFKSSSPLSGYTPLMHAVNKGLVRKDADWIGIVDDLLDANADPNIKNNHGESALSIAEKINFKEAMFALKESGAYDEVRYANLSEKKSLIKAARYNDAGKVAQLLDDGADPNATDRALVTPLLAAAYGGDKEVVTMLIEAGARINRQPEGLHDWLFSATRAPLSEHVLMEAVQRGDTALMMAARRGNADVVAILLRAGAWANRANRRGDTPIFMAAAGGHTEVVEMLLDYGVNPNVRELANRTNTITTVLSEVGRNTPLIKAAEGGHLKTVEALIKAGADVNVQGFMEKTALVVAVSRGDARISELLLLNGADANKADGTGLTSLMLAAKNGNGKIVSKLLEYQADVNAHAQPVHDYASATNVIGVAGATALIFAARGGHTDVVQSLLEAGADPGLTDSHGKTAMSEAENNGYTEVVQLLQ